MAGRNGGHVVVETLERLGASTVFGIPGQHALALFDALADSAIRLVGSRVENNAAFSADGYARATGEVGVLLLSTGPGALTSLAGLQEAYATNVPVLAISSQVPRAGLGGVRTGMLHQLDDQQASAANVAKSTRLVLAVDEIAGAIAAAWSEALTAPQGPVWVEIPQDVLLEDTDTVLPADLDATPQPLRADPRDLDAAAEALAGARSPAIVAGGGVRRSGAGPELVALAECLRAPVATSPGGHGAIAWDHPLSLQGWVEDRHVTDLLAAADVLLVVGSALGEVTSNYYTLAPAGTIVQIDADPRVIGSLHQVTGVHADAREALTGLLERLEPRAGDGESEQTVRRVLADVTAGLDAQDLRDERDLLAALRDAVPATVSTYWDMTILAYWAWSAWDTRDGGFHSAQGAGGLGFGFPAALGAAAGTGERVLAISGDGGAMYGIAELATASKHDLPVTWLIVDDGGFGILRDYMTAAFGPATATELARPDFAALAAAFGVPARTATPDDVAAVLAEALAADGPYVVVLTTRLAARITRP